ncbi:hypothetical protein TcCL_ESM03456 [Trypanosoma cruzi]|nr:hypothetical protein TcCL_ESM03456 [Trypanosoma cruzi]
MTGRSVPARQARQPTAARATPTSTCVFRRGLRVRRVAPAGTPPAFRDALRYALAARMTTSRCRAGRDQERRTAEWLLFVPLKNCARVLRHSTLAPRWGGQPLGPHGATGVGEQVSAVCQTPLLN